MTDVVAIVAALAAGLAADPQIGLEGTETIHLAQVDTDAEWVVAPLPGLAIRVPSTEREALTYRQERVTATLELALTLDGRDGRGNHQACWALAEGIRRSLVRDRLLARGSPLVALLETSMPKGEAYEVQQWGDRGWLQTAIVRWETRWLEPRIFDDAPLVAAKYLRTSSSTPGVGVTEDQPPIPL